MRPNTRPPWPLETQRLAAVLLLLAWSVALILFRMYLGRDRLASGLLWNLFLAVLPLGFSALVQRAHGSGNALVGGAAFCGWLLFLPNAPYLLTDLIHLAPKPGVPYWFLLAMLLSCAGAGTMLGYLSLQNVHAVVEERFGKAIGWSVAVGSLLLCGFGIYLGRFLRWNSWDAISHPLRLARSMARQFINPGEFPHPVPVTIIFGVGLVVGYLAVRAMAAPRRA